MKNNHIELNTQGLSGQFDFLPNEFEINVKVTTDDSYSDVKEILRQLLRRRGIFLQNGVIYIFIGGTFKVVKIVAKCYYFPFNVAHHVSTR